MDFSDIYGFGLTLVDPGNLGAISDAQVTTLGDGKPSDGKSSAHESSVGAPDQCEEVSTKSGLTLSRAFEATRQLRLIDP